MSVVPEELFRQAVGRIFNGWTALQLAVEHGMGGAHGHAKAMGMIDTVVDLFKSKPETDWYEVADVLSEIMDEEFNTLCEDDSIDEVASLVWEYFKHCVSGDSEFVEGEIDKLPSGNHWLSKCTDEIPNAISYESQDNAAGSFSDPTTSHSQMEAQDTEMETHEVDPDPGWTQVRRKK